MPPKAVTLQTEPTRILSIDIGTRNFAYALFRYDNPPARKLRKTDLVNPTSWKNLHIEAWERMDILKESDCNAKNSIKVSIERIVQFITHTLHSRKHLLANPVQHIWVEKQVGMSPRNLMVSVAVLCYFHHYWTMTPNIQYPKPDIRLISNKSKLCVGNYRDVFAFDATHPPKVHHANLPGLSASQNKTRRKNKAIELCTGILTFLEGLEWRQKYAAVKGQRHDYADCFLQAVSELQKRWGHVATKTSKKKPAKEDEEKEDEEEKTKDKETSEAETKDDDTATEQEEADEKGEEEEEKTAPVKTKVLKTKRKFPFKSVIQRRVKSKCSK